YRPHTLSGVQIANGTRGGTHPISLLPCFPMPSVWSTPSRAVAYRGQLGRGEELGPFSLRLWGEIFQSSGLIERFSLVIATTLPVAFEAVPHLQRRLSYLGRSVCRAFLSLPVCPVRPV